jgi:hypothetical protein
MILFCPSTPVEPGGAHQGRGLGTAAVTSAGTTWNNNNDNNQQQQSSSTTATVTDSVRSAGISGATPEQVQFGDWLMSKLN